MQAGIFTHTAGRVWRSWVAQDFTPPIHLTESDFVAITARKVNEDGTVSQLCGENGEMTADQFEQAIRKQIQLFAQRQLSDVLAQGEANELDFASMAMIKIIATEQLRTDQTIRGMQKVISQVSGKADGTEQRLRTMDGQLDELDSLVDELLRENDDRCHLYHGLQERLQSLLGRVGGGGAGGAGAVELRHVEEILRGLDD